MVHRVGAIIQSRLGSTRLPKKALMKIGEWSLIEHVVSRVLAIPGVDLVILAVPVEDYSVYESLLRGCDLSRFRLYGGASANVWERYQQASAMYQLDGVMRITGDCPLLCPMEAFRVLMRYRNILAEGLGPRVFVTNDTRVSGTPDGCDVECFPAAWLSAPTWPKPETPDDWEHVTPSMARAADPLVVVSALLQWPTMKLSVDTEEDLARVRALVEWLGPTKGRQALLPTIAKAYRAVFGG